MIRPLLGGHRRLLFRTYLLLVAGLLAVAVVLQMGFAYLQSRYAEDSDPWLVATLQLVEKELVDTLPRERAAAAAELANRFGMSIQLLSRDDVSGVESTGYDSLVDENGNTWYLYDSAALGQLIYVGPVPEARESWAIRVLPPLFYLSIFVLVGLWLRPLLSDLNRITVAANQFAADYRTPLKTAADTTDLTGLAQNLDDMSARLSGLIQNQKELIAALSHEMRTPLARIRFALAVMDQKPDDRITEQIAALNNDVQEIDDLIATMLNYARLDHPDLQMNWQDVPLSAWLEQTVTGYRGGNKTLDVDVEPKLDTIAMDPRLMTLAVSNLLNNACRYAASTVRICVSQVDGGFAIAVEDDGDGIPEAERDDVFKAFKRLDDSRNRETGGYGLGLAIVARIAALHGGEARVDNSRDLGGACFTMRWQTTHGKDIS